jgi:hypothetical protein
MAHIIFQLVLYLYITVFWNVVILRLYEIHYLIIFSLCMTYLPTQAIIFEGVRFIPKTLNFIHNNCLYMCVHTQFLNAYFFYLFVF